MNDPKVWIRRHACPTVHGDGPAILVSGLGAGLLVYLFRLALIAADQTNGQNM